MSEHITPPQQDGVVPIFSNDSHECGHHGDASEYDTNQIPCTLTLGVSMRAHGTLLDACAHVQPARYTRSVCLLVCARPMVAISFRGRSGAGKKRLPSLKRLRLPLSLKLPCPDDETAPKPPARPYRGTARTGNLGQKYVPGIPYHHPT